MWPDVDELARTVDRMERRLRAAADPRAVELMRAYDRVAERFRTDLQDPRDRLLSQGAALMLVQELLRSAGGEGGG